MNRVKEGFNRLQCVSSFTVILLVQHTNTIVLILLSLYYIHNIKERYYHVSKNTRFVSGKYIYSKIYKNKQLIIGHHVEFQKGLRSSWKRHICHGRLKEQMVNIPSKFESVPIRQRICNIGNRYLFLYETVESLK